MKEVATLIASSAPITPMVIIAMQIVVPIQVQSGGFLSSGTSIGKVMMTMPIWPIAMRASEYKPSNSTAASFVEDDF